MDADTISAVRDRLATLLETVDGLRALDVAADNVGPPPVAMVIPGSPFDEQTTIDDCHDLSFNLVVLVERTNPLNLRQDALDGYAWTVRDAVDTGATADWDFCTAGNPTDYGDYTVGEIVYLGFTLPVTVGVR